MPSHVTPNSRRTAQPHHHLRSQTPDTRASQSSSSTTPQNSANSSACGPCKTNKSHHRKTLQSSPHQRVNSIPTMVHRIAFWSCFGLSLPTCKNPPNYLIVFGDSLIEKNNPSNYLIEKEKKSTNECFVHRPRRALLASRHRDAALLQQVLAVGVPRVRGGRRELRILAAGRGRQADCDAERAEEGAAGEEGEEGPAGCGEGGGLKLEHLRFE